MIRRVFVSLLIQVSFDWMYRRFIGFFFREKIFEMIILTAFSRNKF